ncbi:membrane protein insertion efficiency factor YidD [Ferrigenium sp. UT5]|uniref:membrane protein insertion efficiency factor YidD n=1 Tax=Ferrigenium sp. UT5 TaxID=3242105 RepID=UPI0038B2B642
MKKFLLALLRGYKFLISPILPPACRFHPSCSEYAEEAIVKHGPIKGLWLAVWRVARCNPWSAGGHDPVP